MNPNIDTYLTSLTDWQRDNLALYRKLIHEVRPDVVEDWKWNVPVFTYNGKTYFAMSTFKAHTKYNFILNGAMLADNDKLFNNGFDSKKSRGIDLREGETIDRAALKSLIVSAFAS